MKLEFRSLFPALRNNLQGAFWFEMIYIGQSKSEEKKLKIGIYFLNK